MNYPRPIRSYEPVPNPQRFKDLERLEGEITELAAHINAATFQLLELIGIYNEEEGWELLEQENQRHALRELSCYIDDDGSWVFKGRFTPEQGALIKHALEKAMDEQFAEQDPAMEQTLLERTMPPKTDPESIGARRADALERMAESFLTGNGADHSGGDRYLINIHTEPEVLQADGEGAESECEERSHVSAETSSVSK